MPLSPKNYHKRRVKSQVLSAAALADTRPDTREETGEHNSLADTRREKRVRGKHRVREGGKGLPDPQENKLSWHERSCCIFPPSSLLSTRGRNRLLLWYFAVGLGRGCVLRSTGRNLRGLSRPTHALTHTHTHTHTHRVN